MKVDYSTGYFAYGGMKSSQRYAKIHIAAADGFPLCGVQSNWMQLYGKLDENGMIPELNHLNKNHDDQRTCKKCLIKFKSITNGKLKVGDDIIVIGARMIGQEKFNELFPNGIYGRIIEIKKRFSSSTGQPLPSMITARCWCKIRQEKLTREHRKLEKGYFKKIEIK